MHLPRSSYFFAVFGGPPVAQVALSVELAALVVEAVDDLVSDDHADGAKVHGVIFRGIEDRVAAEFRRES